MFITNLKGLQILQVYSPSRKINTWINDKYQLLQIHRCVHLLECTSFYFISQSEKVLVCKKRRPENENAWRLCLCWWCFINLSLLFLSDSLFFIWKTTDLGHSCTSSRKSRGGGGPWGSTLKPKHVLIPTNVFLRPLVDSHTQKRGGLNL